MNVPDNRANKLDPLQVPELSVPQPVATDEGAGAAVKAAACGCQSSPDDQRVGCPLTDPDTENASCRLSETRMMREVPSMPLSSATPIPRVNDRPPPIAVALRVSDIVAELDTPAFAL